MSSIDARGGFTLIEVLAVMTIVALASTLVLATYGGTGRVRLKSVVLETAALLRRERQSAMLSGRDRMVVLDAEGRAFVGQAGGSVALPRDVALDVLGMNRFSGYRRAVVQFHPDGASTGAVLKFTRDRMEYVIRVNWFTGGVMIDAP
jgi:general secretion pathway protein H